MNVKALGHWTFHTCGWLSRDPTCREHGAPRVHVGTPWGSLIIGVGTRGNSWTQLWLPFKTRVPWAQQLNQHTRERGEPDLCPGGKSNYSRWTSPIVWHPRGINHE